MDKSSWATAWISVSLALMISCGGGSAPATGNDAGPGIDGPGITDPDAPPAACAIEEATPLSEGGQHVVTCSAVTYASNPPASGRHYPNWPVFRAYDQPVPWGFLVHALEHGVVVLAYNCPDGCAADVAEAKALMQAVPAKACGRPPVILTPDPTLATRFAASAWGHVLRAGCFDRARFAAFIAAHANMGPELLPNDCGLLDLETQGWCP